MQSVPNLMEKLNTESIHHTDLSDYAQSRIN